MKSSAWFLPPQAPRILFVLGSVQIVFFPGLVGALVGAAFLHPSFFSPIHLFFLILKVLSKAFEVLFFFQLEYICFTCCVSFCCRAKWISYTYTHISSFLDFLPVSVTTEHQVELLVQSSSFSSVIYFIHEKKVEVLVAQSCLTLCDPMDCTYQAPQSVEFSRQEYWNGLPLPSPEDLPNPGIESTSPALQADSLPLSHQGSTCLILLRLQHPKSDWQTKHAGGVLRHGEAIGEWTEECFLGDSVVKNPPANAGDARHMGFNLGS